MRKIKIKYNPYRVETQILIEGNPVKKNSALNMEDRRFQEWVEELPKLLVDECNTESFHIIFTGTRLDYEDLISVVTQSKKQGIIIECVHIPAKEVKDKEKAIKEIFNDILNGPFDELRQADLKDAFKKATNSEFEVNVVATMSAGKSTLINALLCKKLMPSKQEACTATISRIQDNDDDQFRASAFDSNGNELVFHSDLTYEAMTAMNSDPEVSTIDIKGNIPFVSSDEISLVLIDTPGPNNSRDPNHRIATRRMLDESSKTVVLYILNATQLAVDDDYELLKYVSDSMKVGGKQSKDRYIFVVNKLDEYRKGEDSVVSSIEKVKKYLEDRGIESPNIFPAAALPALGIREYLKDGDDLDEDIMDEVDLKVRRLNRNEELHLEKYAPLTPSIKGIISTELIKAQEEKDVYLEALVHTGIRSIEETINMYVEKYAKTAKIKNIADTFEKKLESARSFESTKKEIIENKEKNKEIREQIDAITKKLESGEEVKEFKSRVDEINYDKEVGKIANNIIKEAEVKITELSKKATEKMTKQEAMYQINEFQKLANNLQVDVNIRLENIITNHVEKNAKALLDEYIKKLASLSDDVSVQPIDINPLDMVEGHLQKFRNIDDIIEATTIVEQEKQGEREIVNPKKRGFFGIFKFWQPKYIIEDIYADVEYVNLSKVLRQYLAHIEAPLYDNKDIAVKYAKDQTENIKTYFLKQIDEIDKMLGEKLMELKTCATSERNTNKVIEELEERLAWLDDIQKRITDILDI